MIQIRRWIYASDTHMRRISEFLLCNEDVCKAIHCNGTLSTNGFRNHVNNYGGMRTTLTERKSAIL